MPRFSKEFNISVDKINKAIKNKKHRLAVRRKVREYHKAGDSYTEATSNAITNYKHWLKEYE